MGSDDYNISIACFNSTDGIGNSFLIPSGPLREFVSEINGIEMNTYLDWMQSCYFISVTGHPAISVPCGFTTDGLPVGLQIVGNHLDDIGVLKLANAFEKMTGFYKKLPELVEIN